MKQIFTSYFFILFCIISFGAIISCKKQKDGETINPVADSLSIGLIAYYPFDNSGVDASGNGNNGMVYNISSVPDRNGKANLAYNFNGSSSGIMVNDNQALRLSNTDFTLNTWVKLDVASGGIILAKRVQGDLTGWTWSLGSTLVYYGPGGSTTNAVACTINTGQWYMVTCVYTLASHSFSIYLNGTFVKTMTGIASPSNTITPALYIGRDDPNPTIEGFFPGSLDDLRIYGRALPVSQIQKLYTFTD